MASNARHVVGLLHSLALGGFAWIAIRTLINISIRDWPRHIFSDPWATATLADWIAGLPLILTHIWSAETSPAAMIWTIAILVIGNAATMLYGMYRVWTNETVTEALLPADTVELAGAQRTSSSGGVRALQVLTGLAFALYVVFGIRALVVEDFTVGYAYITRNGWPLTQYVNTLLGQLFAVGYIGTREAATDNGSLATAAAWILAVVLFGNAATCVYLILALQSAPTVANGILGRHPVTTRGGYIALS